MPLDRIACIKHLNNDPPSLKPLIGAIRIQAIRFSLNNLLRFNGLDNDLLL